jgi:hypothetical protein
VKGKRARLDGEETTLLQVVLLWRDSWANLRAMDGLVKDNEFVAEGLCLEIYRYGFGI